MAELRRRTRGFTLLELLIVVIIIAILAAIAVPQYFRVTEKARAASPMSYLATIRSAEIRYRGQNLNGAYTSNEKELDVDMNLSNLPGWGSLNLVANNTAGMASFTRDAGVYSGQSVGIEFGTGNICGNFNPAQLTDLTCNAN